MPKKKNYPKGFFHYHPPDSPIEPTKPQEFFEDWQDHVIANSNEEGDLEIDLEKIVWAHGRIFLRLVHDYDEDYSCEYFASLVARTFKKVENKRYKRELAAYKKKLATYEIAKKEHKEKLKEWNILKKRWDKEEKENVIKHEKKQFEILKKKYG